MRSLRFLTAGTLFGLCVCLFATSTHAQEGDCNFFGGRALFTVEYLFDTSGPTVCGSNEDNAPEPPNPSNPFDGPLCTSPSDMQRAGNLRCDDRADDAFGSKGFAASYEAGRSIFFTLEAGQSHHDGTIGFNNFPNFRDSLSFSVRRSENGPTEGRTLLSIDQGMSFTELGSFTMSETATRQRFSMPQIGGDAFVTHVLIRFQARFADAASTDPKGAMYLDDVRLTGSQALPVELTAFTARTDGHAAVLRWHTASETRNHGFEIEGRSGGTEEWKRLGFVEGAGTTSEPHDYAYRTGALTPGAHTFRLRQIDTDGHAELHGPVTVEVGLAERFALRAPYPNPARGRATVAFASRAGERVEVALFDALGRRVQTLYAGAPPAGQLKRVRVEAPSLASGLYVVRLRGAGGQVRTRALTLVR